MFNGAFGIWQWIIVLGVLVVYVMLFKGMVKIFKRQPIEKMKYIGVWFLACFIYLILSVGAGFVFGEVFSEVLANGSGNLSVFFIVFSIIDTLVFIGVFIFVYNIFSKLNIKKVFPYLVILSGWGILIRIAGIIQELIGLNVGGSLVIFSASSIVSFFVIIFVIRAYYIRKPDRWY